MKLYAVILSGLVVSQAFAFKDINDGATINNELDSYSVPSRITNIQTPVQDDEWAIISRMRDMHVPPSPDAKDYYSLHEKPRASSRFARTRRSLKFDDASKSVDPGLSPLPRTETQGRQTGLSFEGSSDGKDGDKKFLPGLFGVQAPGYYGGGYPGGGYPGGGYPGGGYPTAGYPYQPIYGQGYYGGGYPTAGYGGYPYPTVGGYQPGLGGGGYHPGGLGGGLGGGGATSSASASAGGGGGYRPPLNALHGNGPYGGYGNNYGNGYGYPNGGTPILGGPGLGGPNFGILGGGFFKDGKDGGVSASSSSNPGGARGSVTFEK